MKNKKKTINKTINQRQDEGKKEVDTRLLKLWWNLLHNKCIVALLMKKLKIAHGGSKVVPGLILYVCIAMNYLFRWQ